MPKTVLNEHYECYDRNKSAERMSLLIRGGAGAHSAACEVNTQCKKFSGAMKQIYYRLCRFLPFGYVNRIYEV